MQIGDNMGYNKVKYNNDYNKTAYDRLNIQVKKGKKEIIEKHWKAKGYKSLNAYVNDLITKDMDQNPAEQKSIKVQNNHGFIIGDNNGTINM